MIGNNKRWSRLKPCPAKAVIANMTIAVPVALFSLLVAISLDTRASCGEECDDVSVWGKFTSIDISVASPKSKDISRWQAQFDHSKGDFRIDADIASEGKRERGTIGMIEGRTMISRSLNLRGGQEIDAIDAPVLMMRLLLAILTRTIPEGPDGVVGEKKLERKESKTGIQFATPSASGHITAPWHARGRIKRLSGDSLSFAIALTGGTADPFGSKGGPIDLEFKGTLGMRTGPVFAESMSLRDWKVYGVGVKVEKRGNSTTYDYGAKTESPPADTVADVRSALKAELSRGKLDATKNFTGMWKVSCDEGHGLQIKPAGAEGMYSVSFCGPGGCFEPGTYRPNTFINGDRSYRVISESEIQVKGGDGFSTYRRCSTDPQPPAAKP